MFHCKELKKFIASLVIMAFVFQVNSFLHSQREDEIVRQFRVAKDSYMKGDYDNARRRIQRIIAIIIERQVEMREILRQCYLLMGAIYEKEKKPDLAKENYRKAREIEGRKLVDEVDLENLPIFREIIKGDPSEKGVIVKPGKKKGKRFPWLLVAGGVLVLGVVVYFLFLKPKKKYQLTVVVGNGVEGSPGTGTYGYKKGKKVNYYYLAKADYSNPKVRLDGNEAPLSGTIKMDRGHTLMVFADQKGLEFVTDTDEISIDEGSTATFKVRLSSQPTRNVDVTVDRVGGDEDIDVESEKRLIFSPSNWDKDQEVTLRAEEDEDTSDDQATIGIVAPGIPQKNITVTERDNKIDKPDVSITSPSNGETVSGTVRITVSAWDTNGISKVEFLIDNGLVHTDRSVRYDYDWDTMTVSDGSHTIKVIAYDNADQYAEKSITVRVNNGGEPPTVSITNPSNGETVSAKVLIKVDALDDKGIDRVEFYIDGELKDTDNTDPYEYVWNTTQYSNATHFIKVIAYDIANQHSTHEITVTVDNR
jgi:hypothetical protein